MTTDSACPAHILDYLETILGDAYTLVEICAEKSAQQQVLVLSWDARANTNNKNKITSKSLPRYWQEALNQGRNHVVVRIWKGAARWWNLHRNERGDLGDMARAEVAGYRMARLALRQTNLQIPTVLHFSLDCKRTSKDSTVLPWAILSYVGPESVHFDKTRLPSTEWVDGMVKIRREFGFDEPHPRWGRVPVEHCLEYTFVILHTVIFPMLRFFLSEQEETNSSLDWTHLEPALPAAGGAATPGWRYLDLVQLHREAHSRLETTLQLEAQRDPKLVMAVSLLGTCIDSLQLEADSTINTQDAIPSVLCHMDLQPQNLIFFRQPQTSLPQILSVLDWEEAAYADPRFEVMLLCRKVCANRRQAQQVWDCFADEMKRVHNLSIGSIKPWLKLETVHSISTLLLQVMDMLAGGRSPWETKIDLWGKINREFQRLTCLGWSFCDSALS